MEEVVRLTVSLFYTVGALVAIMGARYLIRESLAKAYCVCGDEFNQHLVLPNGITPKQMGIPPGEPCKICSCKSYKKNPKDPRNSGSVKFF